MNGKVTTDIDCDPLISTELIVNEYRIGDNLLNDRSIVNVLQMICKRKLLLQNFALHQFLFNKTMGNQKQPGPVNLMSYRHQSFHTKRIR
jgi:hypothetical protein